MDMHRFKETSGPGLATCTGSTSTCIGARFSRVPYAPVQLQDESMHWFSLHAD
ncbi:hypothetical protein A2U01_0114442 [Trifolium medium]|uniref:Uncharacterized protein n=1 Tax=Trifolium medium TaxID=97028 RepID=A0A392VXP5_9FABA|nr:hypothetical protein [Trifolium medium]